MLTSDTRSNNFLSIFFPERSLVKYSPGTQSPNLMTETDQVICIDTGVYVFYMFLYVYTWLYSYVLFSLVWACSYLHIFTYSFGSYMGLIRFHFLF